MDTKLQVFLFSIPRLVVYLHLLWTTLNTICQQSNLNTQAIESVPPTYVEIEAVVVSITD